MPEYKRPCRTATDCPHPLSCLYDIRYDATVCLASECESELQCMEHEVCQAVPAKGRLVRLCLSAGIQEEGKRCSFFPTKATQACKPGLFCNYDKCSRPCRPDHPSDCPVGTFCREEDGRTACAPTCLETGCPSGKECFRAADWPLSFCVTVIGNSCLKTPCPTTQACVTEFGDNLDTLVAWCLTTCDAKTPCANGEVCHHGLCRHPCRETELTDCPADEECVPFPQVGYLCRRRR